MKTFFIRALRRNKGYGVLNMAGLAVGIACAMLIFLWAEDELTYNHQFKNRDNIYKVMLSRTENDVTSVAQLSAPVMGEVIQREIPEVTNLVRLTMPQTVTISRDGDRQIQTSETGYFCDLPFFSMFSVQFLYGNAEGAFRDISSIVLTEKTAAKFFPNENPVGKTLQIDGSELYTVSAVVKDFPDNVSFRFDWLKPYQAFNNPWANFGWTAYSVETIVELHPSADVQTVRQKMVDMLAANQSYNNDCFLFNMNDWRLYDDFDEQGLPTGAKVRFIRLIGLIGLIIIILACINFMNLATAGAIKRAKEVGVLKAIGVHRTILIRRFLGESMSQTFVSVVLGIMLILCVLPVFNQLVSKNLSLNIFTPTHIIAFIVLFVFCGLLSGAYPAFLLSSFNAVNILKGLKLPNSAGAVGTRKTLVVFQFSASICLIVCILVMYGQSIHTSNRDWGYQNKGVVTIPLNNAMLNNSAALLNEIRNLAAIENAGIAQDILRHYYRDGNMQWQGKNPEANLPVYVTSCINSVIATMGMELDAGRDFGDFIEAERGNVIINQRLAQMMGDEGRIGGLIQHWGRDNRIVGIVKDFVFNDHHALRNEPLMIMCERRQGWHYLLHIKIHENHNILSAIQSTEAILNPYIGENTFSYSILEDNMKSMMREELSVARLLSGFSIIAVLISCFGLLGLIAFAAGQRTREIGIRKVFGASVWQMVMLLSKDFLKLVVIACVIAFPVAWWAMNNYWLINFEYRIDAYWWFWIFAAAGVLAMVIAWCTVGAQALNAATKDPVKAVNTE